MRDKEREIKRLYAQCVRESGLEGEKKRHRNVHIKTVTEQTKLKLT